MMYCRSCSAKESCKEICPQLEEYLKKEVETESQVKIKYVGGINDLDYVAAKHLLNHSGGEGVARRVKPHKYNDNWE